jgi:hypothetical protein
MGGAQTSWNLKNTLRYMHMSGTCSRHKKAWQSSCLRLGCEPNSLVSSLDGRC